jgi:hypothetical protein
MEGKLMISVSDSFNSSDYLFDRVTGDFIQLPYTFEKIQIPVNELAVSGPLNLKLDYFYENILYLYSRSKILTNQIPYEYLSWLGVLSGGTKVSWNANYVQNTSAAAFTSVGLSALDFVKDFVTVKTENNDILFVGTEGKTVFYATSNENYTSFNVILSSEFIDEFTQLKNGNITDLIVDGYNLYSIDYSNNTIILYDIEGFIGGENIKKNKRSIKKIIGGEGGRYDNGEFKNPFAADVYNSTLVVMDSGNSCLKFYDSSFNWRYSLVVNRIFRDYEIVDIKLHKNAITENTDIYLLSKNNKIIVLRVLDSSFDVIDFSEETTPGEQSVKYVFSKNTPNIFYVLTNKSVYKKYFSRPETKIGKFDLGKDGITSYNLRAIDLILENQNDTLFAFSRTSFTPSLSCGQFFKFIEPNFTNNMLYSYDFDLYSKDQIHVKNEEYSQAITFNKSLIKLINNNYTLLNQARQRFKFDLDPYLPLSAVDIQMTNRDIYESYKFSKNIYIEDGVLSDSRLQIDCNNFIGNNENFQSDVLNRCLYKIYLQQLALLDVFQGETPLPIPVYPLNCNIITITNAELMQGIGDGAFLISILCN